MEWQEIKVITEEPCVEAIAGLFHLWGAGGVVIEDPGAARAAIARGDWEAHGFSDEYLDKKQVVIRAYYPASQPITDIELEKIKVCAGSFCGVEISMVRDEDWANNWKAFYHTTRVGHRLVIKPSWEDYTLEPGDLVIEIDPGMAFGTGTHITTCQCLQFLEKIIEGGETVLDVGTGSGILAMAAVRLGANKVLALDQDMVAVETAAQNVKLNGLEKRIAVQKLDFRNYDGPQVDILVVNITASVIERLLEQLVKHCKPGGLIIFSGINQSQWQGLQAGFVTRGLVVEEVEQEEEWVGVLTRKCQ